MTCDHCGAYAPPDPDTGDDADHLCPWCQAQEDGPMCQAPQPAADDVDTEECPF